MIVLNTDHLSCLEWGSEESANLRARLAEASGRQIIVSIASYEEQMRGWMGLLAKTPDVNLPMDLFIGECRGIKLHSAAKIRALTYPARFRL